VIILFFFIYPNRLSFSLFYKSELSMPAEKKYTITREKLTLGRIKYILENNLEIELNGSVREDVRRSREVIENMLRSNSRAIYGVTTGFGKFADVRIPAGDLDELQRRIVLSHAAGVGNPMSEKIVKAMMLIKILSLSRGYSGIRPETLDLLISMFNLNILPVIPEKGSVGASGDLAPLAHLALVLIGEGEAVVDGERLAGAEALRRRNLSPVKLKAKEGLAVLNGTQAISAYAVHNIFTAERLLHTATLVGAMSVEALNGTLTAFDERIQKVRGHVGQEAVAGEVRKILGESEIVAHHRDSDHRVQDAYSLRCIPQVHGAVSDTLEHVKRVVETEINGVTDNPLIFADTGEALSGGNFHGEPVAFAMDFLAITVSELGNISERRVAHFLDHTLSELPPFLVSKGGINSGFMMAQVTAAALVSENKTLAHPASVDSVPTSANKEDHVSMGTWAARKAGMICDNVEEILAIEYLCACQGFEFRKPHNPADTSGAAYQVLRGKVPMWDKDRYLGEDMKKAKEVLRSKEFIDILETIQNS
jgi:histidine ammonia-lyase